MAPGELTLRAILALASAPGRRLVSTPGMLAAIRQTLGRGTPAKMKIGMTRIADRPFADAVGERENSCPGHIFKLNRRRFDMAMLMNHRRSGNGADHRNMLDARTARRARTGDAD